MGEEKEVANKYPRTYVITSAQGIQNPHSARHYGRDPSKGGVNFPLLNNIERYVQDSSAELQICAVPGAYVNEIMIDSRLLGRGDVYIEKNARGRLERQIEREAGRRKVGEEKGAHIEEHYFWKIPDIELVENMNVIGKKLNSNACIMGIPEPSQNKDPLVGKKIFTSKYGGGGNSFVMPHPKQRLAPVAKGQSKYPKLMLTTGSVTHPNYNTTNRTGFIADECHEYGFAVVDVIDDKLYLPRIVPALKNGTFVDMGIQYAPGKDPQKVRAWAMKEGDAHVYEIDPLTDKANDEMIIYFRPRFYHVGDVFDSGSIGFHELDNELERMEKSRKNRNNLEEELEMVGNYLQKKSRLAKDGIVRVDYSNHDDMLYRWIAKGAYRNDDKNRKMAHKIAGEFNSGDVILEVALRKVMGFKFKNVEFLKPEDDVIYWGYQFGAHGHRGKNGARGSLKSLKEAYTKVVIGHVHQLEVDEGSMSAGTSSKIPMDYQKGNPSTSMAGNVVLYENGLAQALPIIRGRWKK
jgi:hypothetical protein